MKKNLRMISRFTAVAMAGVLALSACGGKKAETTESTAKAEETKAAEKSKVEKKAEGAGSEAFDKLVEEAKGQTVNFYGWGGDDRLNQWLDGFYAEYLKKNYDITLNRVPMGIEDILTQLSAEKKAGSTESDIDMIWINGENFKTAKENDYLYGPFTEDLPNFKEFINQDDPETTADFSYPIEGYEAPYGNLFYTVTARLESFRRIPQSFWSLRRRIQEKLLIRHFPTLPVPLLFEM